MKYKSFVYLMLFVLMFTGYSRGQIRINSLPAYDLAKQDSAFLGINRLRSVLSLNGAWTVFVKDNRDNAATAGVPCSFSGGEEMTFEKEIRLTREQLRNNKFELVFLGLSYSAEIIVNNLVIYKHPGGNFPFHINLPGDILKTDRKNVLAVRVFHNLRSDNTIPVNQRFLFPQNNGGILRDVFIRIMPASHISAFDFSYKQAGSASYTGYLTAKIENHPADNNVLDSSKNNSFSLRTRLIAPSGQEVLAFTNDFDIAVHKEKSVNQNVGISSVTQWSPQNPYIYMLRVQLFRGEDLIDEVSKPVSFYTLESGTYGLSLNGQTPYTLNGTTYYSSYGTFGEMLSYDRMREDLKLIKSMGFNTVRFAKDAPHPYLLRLCEQIGLLAFIELPVNSIPAEIVSKESFRAAVRNYLGQFLSNYKEYSAVAAIGLGSSWLAKSADHTSFIGVLAELSRQYISKITYASFVGFDTPVIDKLDLYGTEMLNRPFEEYQQQYESFASKIGKGKVFISEATYATFNGSSNGSSNPFSFEAQAKFFSDLIDYTHKNQTPGFFINSAFDYRGDHASFSAGYDKNNIYRIGILDENRQQGRLSQKVIISKLNDGEDVTIPIGSRKDDAPIIFIIFGLVLAMLMGVLMNSRKKFREDATRALLRPYNFYADIRDLRVMSGFHTVLLMIVLSLCSALLQANILYFFRANMLLEKIFIAFGSQSIVNFVSYLAWNPVMSLLWTTAFSLAFFVVASLIVKIASFFVRNKVFFTSIYFTVVWSFLPLIILLPLGLVLYKVLNANVVTIYLFIALLIFTLWIFYRLMKGIYVIFDINPAPVYFYSICFIAVILGVVLLYTHLTESTVYYLLNAFSMYKVI